jgi:glutamate/tyrosine decarboxylase-like PLP-dependent enzyme
VKDRTARPFSEAADCATEYLAEMTDRRVSPSAEAVARLEEFRTPFPADSEDPAAILALLHEIGSPATVANASGRFFGFVNGGALPAALAASWLVSAWDQNAGLRVMSPVAATLEEIALGWVCEALGLPRECGGGLVTGASMASFCCLAAARHALLARAGWDVEAHGLFGAPPLTVVVGEEVHASLLKPLAMLGLGRERVLRVPADGQGRMRADALPRLDERTIVCLQAGNVNTGAFDPAAEVCAAAGAAKAWVHVDGAFGLWAAASPKYRHLTAGYDQADSWATDAHKWPNVGYDCGIALVREVDHLKAAMAVSAAYLAAGAQREPMHHAPESSRRARGVELWAALRSLGRRGLAELIERTCGHAQRFARGLGDAGYEILNEVVINQVLVSFGPAEVTHAVVRRLQEEGTCWCGTTVWQGRTAMRISVSSWATTEQDVERSLAAMLGVAGERPTGSIPG